MATELKSFYIVPSLQEVFEDNLEVAFKNEQLNTLLCQEPRKEWIKTHPFISNYKYLPIDKVEFLLKKIFKRFRIEILNQGTAFNGVWVTVRVWYFNPTISDMDYHDGIGACQLQTAKGTSASDLININNGAISMAFPIAKTIAIKDACDHFGRLFGADLNRKDIIPFNEDTSFKTALNEQNKSEIEIKAEMELFLQIEHNIAICETEDQLNAIVRDAAALHSNTDFKKMVINKRNILKSA